MGQERGTFHVSSERLHCWLMMTIYIYIISFTTSVGFVVWPTWYWSDPPNTQPRIISPGHPGHIACLFPVGDFMRLFQSGT